MGIEKRRYPRLQAKVKVKVAKISQEVKDLKAVDAVSKDIGAAGVCIVTRKPFAIDDIVDLDIILPDGKEAKAVGIVKWAVEQGTLKGLGLNDFYVGVKFVKISNNDRDAIGKFLFDSMHSYGDTPPAI